MYIYIIKKVVDIQIYNHHIHSFSVGVHAHVQLSKSVHTGLCVQARKHTGFSVLEKLIVFPAPLS